MNRRKWWFLDLEFQYKMRPLIDNIYQQIWGNNIIIQRAEDGYKGKELDKILAIDVRIRMLSGQTLTGQEKSLRFNERFYNDLTIEYMQNPQTNEEGDWFNFAGNFYFCGISNQSETEFYPWVIADWQQVQKYTNMGWLKWRLLQNDKHGRASFKAVKIKTLPPETIIKSSYKYHINLGPLFNGYQLKEKL